MILLHGWGAHPGAWQRQVEEFGKRGIGGGGKGPQALSPSPKPPPPIPYRGLGENVGARLAVPGIGKNVEQPPPVEAAGEGACSTSPGPLLNIFTATIPSWTPDWLADYLRNFSLSETIIVGWSLGGMLLVETLATRGALPAAHLVLVGVAPVFCRRPDHPWGQPPGAVRAMRRALRSDSGKVLRDFAARCLAPGEETYRPEVAGLFSGGGPESDLARGLDYLLNADLRPLLPKLAGAVTIVQGEQDRIVAVAQARHLQEHLPGSTLWLLPGAGHLPFWTQAGAFNRILHDIINGNF